MSFIAALLTLVVPLAAPLSDAAAGGDTVHQSRVPELEVGDEDVSQRAMNWPGFFDTAATPIVNQVRIESRVIVRISPQPSAARNGFIADLPRQALPPRVIERPIGQCIAASRIVGVSDRGNRLVFYMRDRSMISARLEKGCSPRDFYLGFYMEQNDDGQLCSGRDRLMSRAGAKCQVSQLNRLLLVSRGD